MSKLLFGVHGLRGSLNNSLALAKQLVVLGHDVTFIGFRDVGAAVEAVGARYIRLDDGPRLQAAVDSAVRTRGKLRSARVGRQARTELLQLAEAIRTLRDLAPDLAIIDMEMHGLVLAAEATQTRTALSIPWHDVYYAPTRPPMHTELGPATGWPQRARIWLSWMRLFIRRRYRRVRRVVSRDGLVARMRPFQLNTAEYANLRKMANNLGVDLSAIASATDWMNPVAYTHAPVMSFTAHELELDRTSEPGVVHVGPIIDSDRYNGSLDGDGDARLDRFLKRAAKAGQSVAYCSMGSLQPASRRYYRSVIEAFADLDDWALILGLGGRGDVTSIDPQTADVLVLAEAPQLRILEHADVAIHPGGTGTFYECVRAGVPSVVMHTGHVDMPGVAARVCHHQLGKVIDRNSASAATIQSTVVQLASSAEVAASLAKYAGVLASYEARSAGVAFIERCLAPSPE